MNDDVVLTTPDALLERILAALEKINIILESQEE